MAFPISPTLRVLLDAIVAGGGRPSVVGGAVRDWIMGIPPKDIDVEVYGLRVEALEGALAAFQVDAVGRTFGVFKVTIEDETFDVALPRRESKAGRGHRGFSVTADPSMSPAEAAGRRDFTVNTVAWDYVAGALIDHHGGVADIERKVLRHTTAAFAEDPLRVLRGCQFAARLDFTMAPETVSMCRMLAGELQTETAWLLGKAEELHVSVAAPRPILMGCHLLALGFRAGPDLGRALAKAFEARLEGAFAEEAAAVAWDRENLRSWRTCRPSASESRLASS